MSTGPFHPVLQRKNGVAVRYDIYVNNRPYLRSTNGFPMRRHEAYAIARLLNSEKRAHKWADKFADPYRHTRKR